MDGDDNDVEGGSGGAIKVECTGKRAVVIGGGGKYPVCRGEGGGRLSSNISPAYSGPSYCPSPSDVKEWIRRPLRRMWGEGGRVPSSAPAAVLPPRGGLAEASQEGCRLCFPWETRARGDARGQGPAVGAGLPGLLEGDPSHSHPRPQPCPEPSVLS